MRFVTLLACLTLTALTTSCASTTSNPAPLAATGAPHFYLPQYSDAFQDKASGELAIVYAALNHADPKSPAAMCARDMGPATADCSALRRCMADLAYLRAQLRKNGQKATP